MPKDRRSHRIPNSARLPKVKTINDLLARADINSIINELDKEKPNMSDLIVIWLDKNDKRYRFCITEDTLSDRATWMLESVKLDVLNEDTEEE